MELSENPEPALNHFHLESKGGKMKSSASVQRMRAAIRIATLWLLAGACPSLLSADTPTNRPDAWRQDLAMLSASLPQLHKNLFFQLREEDFLRASEELDRDIPTLADSQIILPVR